MEVVAVAVAEVPQSFDRHLQNDVEVPNAVVGAGASLSVVNKAGGSHSGSSTCP